MLPTIDIGPLHFPSYFTMLMIGFMLAIYLGWREAGKLGIDQNKILDLSMGIIIAGIFGARLLHVIADGYFWDYVHLCTDPMKVDGKYLPGDRKCNDPNLCKMLKLKDCSPNKLCEKYKRGELCDLNTGKCHPGRDCLRAFKFWYGGLAYYGGFIFAFLFGFWFVKKHKMPVWKVGDIAGFGIPLGLVFGRIGCFLAGCCFGKVSHSPIALKFPAGGPAWEHHLKLGLISKSAEHSLPVLPTQLFSAVTNLIIFIITYYMFKKHRKFDGQIFWLFVILYSITRFIIEYFRDDDRGLWFGGLLSTSQLIGIPLIILGLYMYFYLKKKAEKQSIKNS